VVLAAGRSARMGRAKPLLEAEPGSTFLARVVQAMAVGGTDGVLVVTRPGDVAVHAEARRIGRVTCTSIHVIDNPAAEAGQLSSILRAIGSLPERTAAILVLPVDMPLVRASTVTALLETFRATGAPIVRAAHAGRHGHPVLFAREVFAELRGADPAVGAREVVRSRGALDVPVDDPGVLLDVDTPAEFARIFGRPPG
jgi:molybdenum cofactor cytidylyltransferase